MASDKNDSVKEFLKELSAEPGMESLTSDIIPFSEELMEASELEIEELRGRFVRPESK